LRSDTIHLNPTGDEIVANDVYNSWLAITESESPIPEPSSYALMLAGMGLVACASRRRKVQPF